MAKVIRYVFTPLIIAQQIAQQLWTIGYLSLPSVELIFLWNGVGVAKLYRVVEIFYAES